MDVEASNKPRFCGDDDDDKGSVTLKRHATCEKNTWNSEMRKLVSYEDTGYDDDDDDDDTGYDDDDDDDDTGYDDDDDDDDLPFSARLLRMSNSEICSSNCDDSVKKRPSKIPLKRPLDDSESLYISVKQSKLSLYDDDEDDDDEDIPISRRIERSGISADKSFSVMKKYVEKELALVEKSFEECQRKRGVQEQRLQSLKREIEECSKELGNKKMQVSCVRKINEIHKKVQGKIEECVTDLVAKEAQLYLMEDLIGERRRELKTKEIELHPVRTKEIELLQLMENIDKDRERKEGELEALSIKVAECNRELRSKETELDAMKKLIGGQAKELESERKMLLKVMSMRNNQRSQMKDFESMKRQFEGQVKELELKEKQREGQVKDLESKEKKHFEEQVKELKSKEEQLEGQVKEFESKKEEFEGQIKELESQKKHFESQVKELKSKEKQFEGRVKEHESKEKQLEDRLKEFESKEEEFVGQVKELESKNKHFESQVKEVKSKEKQLEGRLKVFESKEEEFNGQVKELESKRKHFKMQVKELESKVKQVEGWMRVLDSKEKQLEGRVKEFQSREEEVKELKSKKKHFECRAEDFKSKEKHFEGQGKELKPNEEQFEGQAKHHESTPNKFDGQLKDLELREKPFIKSFEEEKESGNLLSPTIDGRNLQLVPSELTDELESLGNDILVNLRASSDPSKLVLDIIQHPFIPQCEKEDNALVIDGSHIILLEQLMRISPVVKPRVREEAMKLALNLKAYISENSENSVAVLVFLLLLSIYGLVPYFDEDEVLKLFGFAAQHEIAVELFGTLGFADKISDFVQNLIGKQQHIEAVRFIRAYNLAGKYQLVGRMQN